MRAGLSQHQALISILLLAVCYIVLNYLLFSVLPQTVIVIIDIALYCVVNYFINLKIRHAT